MLSIGEMAEMTGLSIKALRFYEKEGLLDPAYIDPFSRYRYYTPEQYHLCDIIKGARQIGFGIADIRKLLQERSTKTLSRFLEEGAGFLETRISELEARRESIQSLQTALAAAETAIRKSGVYFLDLPARKLMTAKLRETDSQEDLSFRYCQLLTRLENRGYANSFESGVILEPDDQGIVRPSWLYVAVLVPKGKSGKDLWTLPGGRFACTAVPINSPARQAAKINHWLKSKRIQPSFILQTELLTDPFLPVEYVEIQVPLEPVPIPGRDF